MEKPVKILVYVRGGVCLDVVSNLSEDSWDYTIVDYDNDPDLPEDHIQTTKAKMKILPFMEKLFELIDVAEKVIADWESGDLAESVRQMAAVLAQLEPVPPDEQTRFTVFGYRSDTECPFSTWVAANTVDEAKNLISQQHPNVIICGIVKGWTPLN